MVVVVATLVAIALGSGPRSPGASLITAGAKSAPGTGATPVPAAIESAATSVSASTLSAVGVPPGLASPTRVGGQQPTLAGADGKPEVLYVGAEYCPFCAAERWALVVALSHFGQFGTLSATHSSSTDIYPDTPTFSFYGSTYSSPRLDFQTVELQTNQAVGGSYPTLQKLTAPQQAVLGAYDRAPYSSMPGSIPFVDIGNRFVLVGAGFDPAVLQGKSMGQIAEALSHPSSVIARAVDGSANLLISAIVSATGLQPDR